MLSILDNDGEWAYARATRKKSGEDGDAGRHHRKRKPMEMNRQGGGRMADRWARAYVAFVLIVLGAAIFVPPGLAAAENHEVTVERNVTAKMRDGVTLRADIYRPKGEGKYPVLLVRTPYDKRNETNFGLKAAARGYVVIAQDVRGRFESEGEWYTFKNEPQDGYDTVEWAAALPYSNGKVGRLGGP